jgi:hypothetical protein
MTILAAGGFALQICTIYLESVFAGFAGDIAKIEVQNVVF